MSAERTEKDGLVVCTILGVPFLSCGLREAGLPARVAKNENDRNGVGQIGLLDRGKAFRMVYEPLRLPQEDGHNPVAHRWVINDDKVPTLHIRARRRPAAAINDPLENVPADASTRLKLSYAPAPSNDVLKKNLFRHPILRLDGCSSVLQYNRRSTFGTPQTRGGNENNRGRLPMPSVRMAVTRPGKVEVDVEAMVAFMSEAGTDRSIDAMLAFCRKCLGADFVSIFTYSRTCVPALVGTATTTAADNARKAAMGYMQHFASDVNFALTCRHPAGAYLTYQTADEIASSQYRRACYDRTGIADRFSLVCVGPTRSTSVSVYRSRTSGHFSDCELDRASALMPILKASLDRRDTAHNVPAIGTMEEIQARLKSRYPP